jgi:WD40 repeat protein
MNKRLTTGIGTILLAVACTDPTGPHPGLTILSGGGLSDTIGSILHPPLTVQLLDKNLQPAAGQTVYFGSGTVLVAPIDDPGFVINRLPVITDANGLASVWVEFKTSAGHGDVTISVNGQSARAYYTVLPGAAAYVRADPRDTVLYVGGSVTFRPFITDAHGNRRSDTPTYQYRTLNSALSISAPNRATGAAIGRGSVEVTALGFSDTARVSVVPKGRVVVQGAQGGAIVVTDLDGSDFDTIPGSFPGGRSLDWSLTKKTLVMDRDGPEYIITMDTTGAIRRVVTDPLIRSEFYPRYSPDGSYIYFTGNDSVTTCYGVWRVHPDGTGLGQVVADTSDCGPYAYQGGPSPSYSSAASLDGTRLAYAGRTLRVRTLATGADSSLGVVGEIPRWSPTGEWIAYDSLGTLMLIRPDGTGHQSLLYRGTIGYNLPAVAWSPDGEWLLYSGYDRLTLVQVATGLQLPLSVMIGLADPIWVQ